MLVKFIFRSFTFQQTSATRLSLGIAQVGFKSQFVIYKNKQLNLIIYNKLQLQIYNPAIAGSQHAPSAQETRSCHHESVRNESSDEYPISGAQAQICRSRMSFWAKSVFRNRCGTTQSWRFGDCGTRLGCYETVLWVAPNWTPDWDRHCVAWDGLSFAILNVLQIYFGVHWKSTFYVSLSILHVEMYVCSARWDAMKYAMKHAMKYAMKYDVLCAAPNRNPNWNTSLGDGLSLAIFNLLQLYFWVYTVWSLIFMLCFFSTVCFMMRLQVVLYWVIYVSFNSVW